MPARSYRFACIALLFGSLYAAASQVQIISDEQAPLVFSLPGQPPRGLVAEMAEQLSRHTGQSASVQLVSYGDVNQRLGATPDNVYLLADKPLGAKLGLTLVGPLLRIRGEIYTLNQQAARIMQLGNQMLSLPTVAESGSNGEIMAKQAGFRVYRVTDNDQAARLLQSGRAMLWATDNITASIQQKVSGGQALSSVRTLYEYDLYLGFSRNSNRNSIEQWRQALETMKQDGSFQRLVQKWAPDHFPPQHTEILRH